jgi:hypothetical protein
MSAAQACAEVAGVIDRARSLFVADPAPCTAAAGAANTIGHAAESTVGAGQVAAGMSGAVIDVHQSFVAESAGSLSGAARTDTVLGAQVSAAAQLTQEGAARLATLAAENAATSRVAATVSTPAGERAVLVELRSQAARASEVVSSAKQQATELAGQARALQYPRPAVAIGGGSDTSAGPDDQIVAGPEPGGPHVQLVDNTFGSVPQDPPPTPAPPPPPVTGEPIHLPPAPPRPVQVIDASPPDGDAAAPHPGFPKCPTSDNLKHIGELLAGAAIFGISIPADVPSLGAATPGLLSGGYMVYDGFDELRKCE